MKRQSGSGALELHPQLAHVDVDGAVAGPHLALPHEPEQLLARDDPVRAAGQLGQQPQLAGRERQRAPAGAREVLVRRDLERPRLQDLGPREAVACMRSDARFKPPGRVTCGEEM